MEDLLLTTQIKLYKEAHNQEALSNIITKMQPLIRKCARKLYFMEKEDAVQEMTLALIECICKIREYNSEVGCLTYIKKSIINRYIFLCKSNIETSQINIMYDDIAEEIPYIECFDEIEISIDLNNLLKDKTEKQKCIVKYIFIDNLSDIEISHKMDMSRQYINRVKKRLLSQYFS